MKKASRISASLGMAVIASVLTVGCSSTPGGGPDLVNRAYIVARDSDDLTVIDLNKLEIVGRVHTQGVANHMAELNADFTKLYVASAWSNESIVVDAAGLEISSRIATGAFPTHVSLSRDGKLLAVMNEYADSVSFIDPGTDREIKRLGGFYTPHFMRYSPDGKYGYVANIGAYHLTRVELASLEIVDHIPLDGYAGPPNATPIRSNVGRARSARDSADLGGTDNSPWTRGSVIATRHTRLRRPRNRRYVAAKCDTAGYTLPLPASDPR